MHVLIVPIGCMDVSGVIKYTAGLLSTDDSQELKGTQLFVYTMGMVAVLFFLCIAET